MKKLFTIILVFAMTASYAQVDGTWMMSPQAAALGVGPGLGDISWWSNSEGDLTTRACYFDDRYVFSEDGTFANEMDGESWIEPWQGSDPEACGTPVAPHDGSNAATWSYDPTAGTVTLDGVGAFLGLAKVINEGEITDPSAAPSSITYPVEFSADGDTMEINISIGSGYWRYILVKAGDPSGIFDNEISPLEVFPNPATDIINIANHSELSSIKIYSVTGSMVYESVDVSKTIDVSTLIEGVYFIQGTGFNGSQYSSKFIVN